VRKGSHHSAEARDAIAAARRGQEHSEETRRKIGRGVREAAFVRAAEAAVSEAERFVDYVDGLTEPE